MTTKKKIESLWNYLNSDRVSLKGAKTPLDWAVIIGAVVFGYVMAKYLGLVLVLYIIAYLVGNWFAKWYMKREQVSVSVVKWIVWSNVVTWLLPPLGLMTGFAALAFGNYFPGDCKKYKTIAILGIVASFLNSLSGILFNGY